MQPCLGTTTNVIPVLIRQQRWLYFVLAKYARENAHPQIRQLTVVMSHRESHMPCERWRWSSLKQQSDCFAVERWVLMSQNTVTVNTSSTKRKYGEDGLPNETPTTTQPSTPSMKTPTQNSTTITSTTNIIPSTYECHSLSLEFPTLSSFNPEAWKAFS